MDFDTTIGVFDTKALALKFLKNDISEKIDEGELEQNEVVSWDIKKKRKESDQYIVLTMDNGEYLLSKTDVVPKKRQ